MSRHIILVGAVIASLNVISCSPADVGSRPDIVSLPSALQSHPDPIILQGALRRPKGPGPFGAVVLLHGCGGGYLNLDEHWGKTIASWGYVSLSIDSFGPRGITETCNYRSLPNDMLLDAYRGSHFLAQQPYVDRKRLAMIGFSRGGGIALWSVDGRRRPELFADKFRAAVAFYPPCRFAGKMTVPTLILIGERDDWTTAQDCRDMAAGVSSPVLARRSDDAYNVQLIVYPDAYHGFDAFEPGKKFLGHWLEYNKSAADHAAKDLRKFLDDQIGDQ
jgi:dienelactone hydrolase